MDGLRYSSNSWRSPWGFALSSAVAPFPALLHGTSFDEENRKGFGYSQMYNLTGWPTATVRVGTSPEGLPLGVQVAARPWRTRHSHRVRGWGGGTFLIRYLGPFGVPP